VFTIFKMIYDGLYKTKYSIQLFCVYKTKTFKVKVSVFQICLGVCKSEKQIPKATFFIQI